MNDIKLLPCPFCGGEAVLDKEDIFCDNCHLSMRIDDRVYNREAETFEEARKQAMEQWNTRKPIDRIVEQLEELYKYNSEQAMIYANADVQDAYMREKKELYMEKASCFGVAIRTVKAGGVDERT